MIRAQEALRSPDDIEREAAERGLAGWDELAAFLRHYLSVLDASSEVDFAGARRAGRGRGGGGRPAVRPRDGRRLPGHDLRGRALPRARSGRGPSSSAGDLDAHVFSFQGTTDDPFRRFAERNPGAASVELETPASSRARVDRGLARRTRLRAARRDRARAPSAPRRGRGRVARARGGRPAPRAARRRAPARPRRRARPAAGSPTRASPAAVPATRPFVLALRWLVAGPQERDALIEPVLTSELGRLSPASVRTLLRLARAHGRPPRDGARAARPRRTRGRGGAAGARRASLARAEAVRRTRCTTRSACSGSSSRSRPTWWSGPRPTTMRSSTSTRWSSSRTPSPTAGTAADPSTEAFLLSLGAAEGAPTPRGGRRGRATTRCRC